MMAQRIYVCLNNVHYPKESVVHQGACTLSGWMLSFEPVDSLQVGCMLIWCSVKKCGQRGLIYFICLAHIY
jgi:hypothetical protein